MDRPDQHPPSHRLQPADLAAHRLDDDDGESPLEVAPGAAVESRSLRVEAHGHGQRLDKLLVGLAPEFSRSHLQNLIERGHVRLDGDVAGPASRRVRVGQQLQVQLVPTDESLAFRPQAMALQVVYEDPHLLVIDKPVGLVVHPAPGHWQGTLLNGLLAHHTLATSLPRAGIVHRLDKDTSGLMLVGKTLPAVTALVRAIAAREVQRRYLGLAWGAWPLEQTIAIEAPIGRDPVSRIRMAVTPHGRPARTDVHCVGVQDGVSALMCALHSGRTHQIRVHLAHRGHPLLADALYGGRPGLGLVRQGLHAAQLRLLHPVSGKPLRFDGTPPEDFATAWAQVTDRPARWTEP